MTFGGVCITTNDATGLVSFYQVLLQEEPIVDGDHYSFSKLAIWNSGNSEMKTCSNIWLQFVSPDIDTLYARIMKEIPHISILSPPERKPWGAYSFWIHDPDGNSIAVAQMDEIMPLE